MAAQRSAAEGHCETEGHGCEFRSRPVQEAPNLDNWGMERKTSPVFFTERGLAAYLSVSDRTIRNWIRRGELPSYKLGAARRIDPSDVDAFLAQRREEAA
jgi:excisionase family DNA binding protein